MVINTNKYVYNVFLKMCVIFQHLKSISASQTNGTGLSKKKKYVFQEKYLKNHAIWTKRWLLYAVK